MTQSEPELESAVEALCSGRPVLFPTETVYGLGLAVEYASSPHILYELKRRMPHKPIAWLVDSPAALKRYGRDVPTYAFALAQKFWPGPLTLIIKANDQVPSPFLSAESTIGLRCPAHSVAQDLIRLSKSPLATTSANISGTPAAQSFDDVDPLLRDLLVGVQNDGMQSGVASTVVDCTQKTPHIIREGSVTEAEIQACCMEKHCTGFGFEAE